MNLRCGADRATSALSKQPAPVDRGVHLLYCLEVRASGYPEAREPECASRFARQWQPVWWGMRGR